jgi:RHS repeat-associated protein
MPAAAPPCFRPPRWPRACIGGRCSRPPKLADPASRTAVSGRRYYSPSQGRFLGKDPKKEKGGLNLYGFVLNNPINLWDYLGMELVVGIRSPKAGDPTDVGHVFVGVVTNGTVTKMDWIATGGAGGLNYNPFGPTFLSGDATVKITDISLKDFMGNFGTRTDVQLFSIATTSDQDVTARFMEKLLRDVANASSNDSLYNLVSANCADASLLVVAATGAKTPDTLIATTSAVIETGVTLTNDPTSGWINLTAVSSTPAVVMPTVTVSPGTSGQTIVDDGKDPDDDDDQKKNEKGKN